MGGNFGKLRLISARPAHRVLFPTSTPRFVTPPWQSGGEPRGLPLCAPPTPPGGAFRRGLPVAPPPDSLSSADWRGRPGLTSRRLVCDRSDRALRSHIGPRTWP